MISYSRPALWDVLDGGKPYQPFPWQAEHIHSKVDQGCTRIILPCGRRSGKSVAMIGEVAREVVKPPVEVMGRLQYPIVYIVGPTTEASMRVWEPIWNAFVPSESGSFKPALHFLYEGHDKNRGVIFIKGGARIYRKTADDPRSLQGERVTLVVTDESHDINEDAWENVMPGLADSEGRLLAIGIPKGKGRFRSYFMAGQGMNSEFYSASVPTTANIGFVERAEAAGLDPVEYLRQRFGQDLTDAEFERQYLAKWVEEDGQVFANFEKYFTGQGYGLNEEGRLAIPREPHIMSLDLGKLHDFTVAYVGNVTRQEIVAQLRFNKIDYIDQVPRIADLYRQYGCRFIHMDANGVGEAPSELLRREGCSIIPFGWTNATKQGLISTMVREVQRGHVTFLESDDALRKEMGLFEGTVSPGGVLKYEAPKGFYDDCVIAAALLIQKMYRNRNMNRSPMNRPYVSFSKRKRHKRSPHHSEVAA